MLLKIGPTRLAYKVLVTLMVEVSEIVTGHPLIPVATDPDFPFILSPGTLLTQKTGALLPLLG